MYYIIDEVINTMNPNMSSVEYAPLKFKVIPISH